MKVSETHNKTFIPDFADDDSQMTIIVDLMDDACPIYCRISSDDFTIDQAKQIHQALGEAIEEAEK